MRSRHQDLGQLKNSCKLIHVVDLVLHFREQRILESILVTLYPYYALVE